MVLATMTSKGQTTIPKEIRDYLNLRTGDEIAFYIQDGNVLIKPMTGDVRELRGCLKKYASSRPVSVEEMNQAIRRRFK
jgi:antitoxin PrlF